MSANGNLPAGWQINTSKTSGFRYFSNRKMKKSFWVCEQAKFGWSWYFNSKKEKAYFNIITKERMIEAPPAAAPSGDQLAMKKKVKKKKKKKTKKNDSGASQK